LERRRFLTSSAYSAAAALLPLGHLGDIAARAHHARLGSTVGMADVAAVRDMLSMFTDMDERHGGQHGRTALITYLRDDVAPLCRARFASDTVRSQMLSAASRGVHLAGFKAYDAGQQGLAQRYYLQSFSLATEGGLPGNAAFTLRTMAMQGLKRTRPKECQALAQTGLDWAKGRVDAHTEAEFHAVYAHTLAEGGQTAAALEQVNHAYRLITTPRPDDPPFWALAWGPSAGSVYARIARVFTALRDPNNAADLYGQAVAARPDAVYARVNALNLAAKARLQLKQGHIEAACASWGQSLDRMTGVHSTRARKAVGDMRRDLSPFRARGVYAAAQLDDRAAAFIAQHTLLGG
jgi:tetratricopeptide (TPR) repeat protein